MLISSNKDINIFLSEQMFFLLKNFGLKIGENLREIGVDFAKIGENFTEIGSKIFFVR